MSPTKLRSYDLSTDPRLGRFRRRFASWLGLVVLALNILAGGFLLPHRAEAGAGSFVTDVSARELVICTTAGMVVLDRDGKPVGERQPNPAHGGVCQFCLPLMHGATALAVEQDAGFQPFWPVAVHVAPDNLLLPTQLQAKDHHLARAPPFS